MGLGPFAGPIYTIILVVECIFFLFLEWWLPRDEMDFVSEHWNQEKFVEVSRSFAGIVILELNMTL